MKLLNRVFTIVGAVFMVTLSASAAPKSIYDLTVSSIDGVAVPLSKYRGEVLLVVNTALKCGTTIQYGDLQKLFEKYKNQGFEVLAFPTNDFSQREPKDPQEVKATCKKRFGITFPLFEETHVTGDKRGEIFNFLTSSGPEEFQGPVGFNFEKFLVGRDGAVRARFGPFTNSMSSTLTEELEKLIAEPKPEGDRNG